MARDLNVFFGLLFWGKKKCGGGKIEILFHSIHIYFFTTCFTTALCTSEGCWYKNKNDLTWFAHKIIPYKNPCKDDKPCNICVGMFMYQN